MQQQILITGMYRSGTTLLHHLLDGHHALTVFPFENCIFRDSIVAGQLPFPKQRSIQPLLDFIQAEKTDDAIAYILGHEKLKLALGKELVLKGSVGDQKIAQEFDFEVLNLC